MRRRTKLLQLLLVFVLKLVGDPRLWVISTGNDAISKRLQVGQCTCWIHDAAGP